MTAAATTAVAAATMAAAAATMAAAATATATAAATMAGRDWMGPVEQDQARSSPCGRNGVQGV
jgi:hypothetical protein